MLLWTPPHFWALALLLAPRYKAAGVPMLPVVRGPSPTTVRVLGYSGALVVATVLPGVLGVFGGLYLRAAILLDAVLCVLAWRLWREATPGRAGALFHWSLLLLALLFVAVAADAALG